MDNPYLPPLAVAPTEFPPESPVDAPTSPTFDPSSAAFLTIAMAFVGACLVQVASLVPLMFTERRDLPENFRSFLLGWFAYSVAASFFGLHGGYHALRRGSPKVPSLLTFFLFYCFTAKVGNVSFGWPFQLHIGMAFGGFGLGINLVGIGMVLWWTQQAGPRSPRV